MQRLACVLVLALAGCPPPPRFIVTDVTGGNVPLNDALVALHCARKQPEAAMRTDDTGRARLPVTGNDVDVARCTVTVAKPGFRTVEASGVQLCTNVTACPPMLVQLMVLGVVPPGAAPDSIPVEVTP